MGSSYPQNFYGQSNAGGYSANWGGGFAAQTPVYGGGYTAPQTPGYGGGGYTASPVAASMASTPRPTSGSFVGYQPGAGYGRPLTYSESMYRPTNSFYASGGQNAGGGVKGGYGSRRKKNACC